MRRRVVAALVVAGLSLLFAGRYGLLAAVLLVGARVALPRPRWWPWAAAAAFLALAPFALLFQGLPRGPVPGPGFGMDHMLAHVLVGLSLVCATLAALEALLEERSVLRGDEQVRDDVADRDALHAEGARAGADDDT